MEKLAKGTKVTIKDAPDGFKHHIGAKATAGEHLGVSGETQLFDLTVGGGLFLRPDQIERAA